MTDRETIQGLIARDSLVTERFFFTQCRPMFCKIIGLVFNHEVDYDEFVNELYVYLMENDAQKLRDFEYRCSVYTWLKVLAVRYFISKRNSLRNARQEHSLNEVPEEIVFVADEEEGSMADFDISQLLEQMTNKRYVFVIKRLILDGCEPEQVAVELKVTTANLYNIKRRAMIQLSRIALNDINEYGK